MAFKFIALFAVLAVVNAGGLIQEVHQPILTKTVADIDYDPNPRYSYSYDIQDSLTGDSKNAQETRDGDVVSGQYSLNDADGYRRIVDYTADPINGFNAVVRREPLGIKTVVKSAPVAYAAAPATTLIKSAPIAYAAAPAATYVKSAPFAYAAAPAATYVKSAPFAYAAAPSATYIKSAPFGYAAAPAPATYIKSAPFGYAAAPATYVNTASYGYAAPTTYINSSPYGYAAAPTSYIKAY